MKVLGKGAVVVGVLLVLAGCVHDQPQGKSDEVKAPEPKAVPAEPVPTKEPVGPAKPPAAEMKAVFPGVRVAPGVVEIDGKMAADTRAFAGKIVFLEVIACRPDSREHEALIVTQAEPSHLHAALLLAGANSGSPGSWRLEGKDLVPVPPKGDKVEVTIRWKADGRDVELAAAELIRSTRGGSLAATHDDFVFAGSGFVKNKGGERYAADLSGTLVGLCTFGDETVAWTKVYSPDAETEEPQWIADGDKLPAAGTPATLVLRLTK